jgi:release factor glutamine methyltransferase
MTIKELIEDNKKLLLENNINPDLAKTLYILMSKTKEQQLLLNNKILSSDFIYQYKENIKKMLNNIPTQYIVGYTNFYGYDFIVNNKVLIPRFETEELIENTIKYIKEYFSDNITIADIGTGSGAIGITIKKEIPNAKVYITDISKDALEVADTNRVNLNADVNILQGDMLEPLRNIKLDIIISNPPYIKEDETVEDIVKDNEPNIALYGGKDGLFYYDKILANAKKYLNKKSMIAFEISDSIKEELELLAKEYFKESKVIIKKDLQDRYRMLFILNNID